MNITKPFKMLTVDTGIVGLHVGTLDFPILSHQCITLATVLAKDGSTLEKEVEVFGELAGWITQEADLVFRDKISGRRIAR